MRSSLPLSRLCCASRGGHFPAWCLVVPLLSGNLLAPTEAQNQAIEAPAYNAVRDKPALSGSLARLRSGISWAKEKRGETMVLRHVYKVGSLRRYLCKATFTDKQEDKPVTIVVTGILQVKVEAAKSDGTASLAGSLDKLSVKINGGTLALSDKAGVEEDVPHLLVTRVTLTQNRLGLVTACALSGEVAKNAPSPLGPSGNVIAQIFAPVYSARRVGMGDSWMQEIGNFQPHESRLVPILQTTLLGRERQEGHPTLKLHMTTTVLPDGKENPARYNATGYADPKTGEYVRLYAALTGGDAKTGIIRLEMTLLSATKP